MLYLEENQIINLLFRICRNQAALMQVGHATEDDGPDDCADRTDDILWDEEQRDKDNAKEGNGERAGDRVPRHFEAIWQEVGRLTILSVSDHGKRINDDVHVVR